MKHKEYGFTFVEILVVLSIISTAIVLSSISIRHDLRQGNAKSAGQMLFQYHNALKSFAMSAAKDPSIIKSSTNVGLDWLKDSSCGGSADKPHLPCSFEETHIPGDLSFNSVISTSIDSTGRAIVSIRSESTPYQTDSGEARPDLAGIAAIAAGGNSTLFSPASSSLGSISSDPSTAQITINAHSAPILEDVWLYRDGSNTMQGSINFENTDDEKRTLENVYRVSALDGESLILGDGSILTGDLVVNFDTEIHGQLLIQDDVNISGDFNSDGVIEADQSIHAVGNIHSHQDILVKGTAYAKGNAVALNDIHAGSNMNISGNSSVLNDAHAHEYIETNKDIFVYDGVNVNGAITTNGEAISHSDISSNGNLRVDGSAHTQGETRVADDIIGLGMLKIAETTKLDGNLEVKQDAIISNNLFAQKNLTVTGYLKSQGEANLKGNLIVEGNSTIDSLEGDLTIRSRATEGRSCSPNGRIATKSNGEVLSCVSGKWKKPGGFTLTDYKSGFFYPRSRGCKTTRLVESSWVNCDLLGTGTSRIGERYSIYKSGGYYHLLICNSGYPARAWWQCYK
ncbi:prepilin-type N-terminal cleavage/methylation domain-containing protein [Neptuniibacter sp. QD37_11]|uniref:prepilin-type N-terminal cleavage/methylation domain-containing protein n=1 Tax=Neptuniibacter sp. QD37_11 TaxID=3398209 RepID=UPI0039F5B642